MTCVLAVPDSRCVSSTFSSVQPLTQAVEHTTNQLIINVSESRAQNAQEAINMIVEVF